MKMGYSQIMEKKKWMFPLMISSVVCIVLLATSLNMGLISSLHTINSIFSIVPLRSTTNGTSPPVFAESKIVSRPPPPPPTPVPRLAYLISGSKGDLDKLWRTLAALYHPWNHYIVHLDVESPVQERLELAARVRNQSVFAQVGNVHVVTKANMVTYRGPTMVANTLHACAIFLKKNKDWDWFINLSASDYPLVTQDDLLHTFSTLDRSLNFIEHTSQLGWKADKRAMPLIVDPGLYLKTKKDIFTVTPRRTLPTAFKLFTGSAWMVLSHSFVDYMVTGWENLPRLLLMYYTNFVSSPEGYFQTVICNEPEYAKTVVNHDLHYISWDYPPKQHPHTLTVNDTGKIIMSGAAFGRKFRKDDPVLDRIDKALLRRERGALFTPGGWCAGSPKCSEVGDPKRLEPGPGANRLRRLVARLVLTSKLGQNQCK